MRGSVSLQAMSEATGEAYVRVASRAFILAFYGTMRNLRLYPFENAVVQQSLQELSVITGDLIAHEKECEFRVAGSSSSSTARDCASTSTTTRASAPC